VTGPEDTSGNVDATAGIGWGERLRTVKNLATRIGPILSKEIIHTLDASISYLETGRWLKSEGIVVPKRVESRANVYDQLINTLRDKPILYLEFGVWQGRSIRYWSEKRDCFRQMDRRRRSTMRACSFSRAGLKTRFRNIRRRRMISS
jgi:hypothetical protein